MTRVCFLPTDRLNVENLISDIRVLQTINGLSVEEKTALNSVCDFASNYRLFLYPDTMGKKIKRNLWRWKNHRKSLLVNFNGKVHKYTLKTRLLYLIRN